MSIGQSPKSKTSFWRRQFEPTVSQEQTFFDVFFGIGLPAFCLVMDPVVFRETFLGRPSFSTIAIWGYTAIGLEFGALIIWLWLKRPSAFLAGLLCGGALFAAVLGVMLLPLSLIGLLIGIGILGFAPFLTAFVYCRNAWRAHPTALGSRSAILSSAVMIAGLLIALGLPVVTQMHVNNQISRGIELLLSRDAAKEHEGVEILSRYGWMSNLDSLVRAFDAEEDQAQMAKIASWYEQLTGNKVEWMSRILND